jgi:hypothetical protein
MINWGSKDVKSDGSCFYRALYISAKKYHTGSLVENIYDCFGRTFLKEHDTEDAFVEMIRDSLASRIENGFYNAMVDEQIYNVMENVTIKNENVRKAQIEGTMGLYETLMNWAANADDTEIYSVIINELPNEFKRKFKKPQTLLQTSKDDFYNYLASLIRRKSVYASEYDIVIVKFILQKCIQPIFLNMIHRKEQCIREKDDIKAINIQRVNENHYISWIEKNKNSSNSNSSNSSNSNSSNSNSSNSNKNSRKKHVSLKNIISRRRTKRNNL